MNDSTRFSDMRTMLIIVLIAMVGLMGIDLHLASMPYIMAYMHTDKSHLQQSITLYLLGLALSLLISGPLSDKFGRKPIVIFGLIFACVTNFACIFTSKILLFLAFRFLQGLAAGSCSGLGRTMAVDMYHRKSLESMRHYFSAVIGLSPLLAPLLGGYFQHYFGWKSNFVFLGAFFLALIPVYYYLCEETNKNIRRNIKLVKNLLPTYLSLLKHYDFVGAIVIAGIGMAVSIVYVTISPFVFHFQYHLTPIQYGWVTTGVAIGVILGRLTNGYVVNRIGNLGTLKLGIILLIFSGGWVVFFQLLNIGHLAVVLAGVFIALYGQLFIRANAMFVALLPHKDKRGAAGALFGSSQTLLAFLAGALVSIFPHGGMQLLGIIYLILGVLASVVYFGLIKRNTIAFDP